MPTGPITETYGRNAGGEWGLYPAPADAEQLLGCVPSFVGLQTSNRSTDASPEVRPAAWPATVRGYLYDSGADFELEGLDGAGTAEGDCFTIATGLSTKVKLKNADGAVTPTDRFQLPEGNDLEVKENSLAVLQRRSFSGGTLRWVVTSTSEAE